MRFSAAGQRLTYANVVATLAVFIALGGSAWALSRNEVRSRHIAPGEVKRSDTSDALRLKCPSGTRYHEGACVGTSARPSAEWADATTACESDGMRLPTPADLEGFRHEPGVELGSEWSSALEIRGDGSLAARIVAEPDQVAEFAAISDSALYRCVAATER